VVAALPMLDSNGVAVSMKAGAKHSTPVRSFLRRGFFKNSLAVHVSPHLSPKVSVATPSTLVLKEDGVKGAPSLLCEVFNGLIQSQKWPVSFGPSREIVMWDEDNEVWDGEDGDSLVPFGVFLPGMLLDWALNGVEDEDPSSTILDAIEEDFHREVKVARPKTKGRRQLLNLKSSINYSDASATSQ
jgi:hypothetical protein